MITFFLLLICIVVAVLGAWTDAQLGAEYFRDPLDPLTLASCAVLIVGLTAFVKLIMRRVLDRIGATAVGLPRSWMLIIPTVLVFPVTLAILDRAVGLPILEASCRDGDVADYFLLAFDGLAKGAFIDVMESFRIDLHRCGYDETSWPESTADFAMRSFTTGIIVHTMLHTYDSFGRVARRDFVIGS